MYWTKVKWLSQKWDKYGFVNETEIRIATGLALVLWVFSFVIVLFKWNFEVALYSVWILRLDFVLKTIFWAKFSILWIIVRPFIKSKEKLWVWAVQKRFAWSIGLVLSSFVMYCILLLWEYVHVDAPAVLQAIQTLWINISQNALIVTPMNPAILACVLCIIFMWFEAVVWYCVWCAIYKKLVEKGIMKEHIWQNCVNGACEMKK